MGDFQIYNKNNTFGMKSGVINVDFISFREDDVATAESSEPKLTNIYMIFGLAFLYVIVISWYVYVVITVVIS